MKSHMEFIRLRKEVVAKAVLASSLAVALVGPLPVREAVPESGQQGASARSKEERPEQSEEAQREEAPLWPPLLSEEEAAAVRAQLASRRPVATLHGGFWTLEEGFESELGLINGTDERLGVVITLFSGDGRAWDLPPLMLKPHAMHQIELRAFVREVAPTVLAHGVRFGHVRLRHTGVVPTMVASMISITHPARGLSFDVPVEPVQAESSRLEAVFGRVDEESEVRVILSNISDHPLPVNLTLAGQEGLTAKQEVILGEHQTVVVSSAEMLGVPSGPYAVGVSLEYEGAPGSLLARGLVFHEAGGLSSTVAFVDPATLRSRALQGAGLIVSGSQVEGLAPEALLEVWLSMRNVGAEAVQVRPTLFVTERGRTRRVALGWETLAPQEVRRMNLSDVVRAHGARAMHVQGASLELRHTGRPGSVVGHLMSVHREASLVFDVPLRDADATTTNAWNYPWTLEGEYNTVVYLSNTTGEEQEVGICLMFPTGGAYQLDLPPLRAWETVAIDLRELRARAEPDVNGDEFPRRASRGTFMWKEKRGRGAVMGRAVIYSVPKGISHSVSCPSEPLVTRCVRLGGNPLLGDCWNSPDTVVGVVGETAAVTVYQVLEGCCSGSFVKTMNVTGSAGVVSGNPSVVQVETTATGKRLRFVGPGQTSIWASFSAWDPTCHTECGYLEFEGTQSCSCVQDGSVFVSFSSSPQGVTVSPKVTVVSADICTDAIRTTLEPSSARGTFRLEYLTSGGTARTLVGPVSRSGGSYTDSFQVSNMVNRIVT